MKSLVLVTAFMAFTSFGIKAQSPPASADFVLQSACRQAGKENKNVIVIFHASWCVWCHKMDNSINDPVCKKFFDDNYVITHLVVDEAKDKLNLENPGAGELRKKYYGDAQGIPFWLVFDKDGKLLADSKMREGGEGPEAGINAGCPASEKEVAYLLDVLRKTSGLTTEQLAIVGKRFRQNE